MKDFCKEKINIFFLAFKMNILWLVLKWFLILTLI
jgi:hypothetical protein